MSDPGVRAAWLLDRFDRGECNGLGDWVPGGFDAYVRVLHPFSRDRPRAGDWAEYEALCERLQGEGRWEEIPELVDEGRIAWRDTAASFGRELGPTTRVDQLLGAHWHEQEAIAPDGWRYHAPDEGDLDAETLAALVRVLLAHTATPSRGIAAVWEGYGGLMSGSTGWLFALSETPRPSWVPAWAERSWDRLRHRLRHHWMSVRMTRSRFGLRAALHRLLLPRSPLPQGTGLLAREVVRGPRLELPDGTRDYLCFEIDPRDFASGAWPRRAPWCEDDEADGCGFDPQSPNLVWPDDRSWVIATEVDFDSTIVACSRECADALLAAAPGLEAFEIARDTRELWTDYGDDA